MRKLRLVISNLGGVGPTLAAFVLAQTDACGARTGLGAAQGADATMPGDVTVVDVADVTQADGSTPFPDAFPPDTSDGRIPISCNTMTYVVPLPPPGVPADPGQLCAVTSPPAVSNAAARVTLTSYAPSMETAKGFVAIPPALLGSVVGLPALSVTAATPVEFGAMKVANMTATGAGFSFDASWPPLPHPDTGGQIQVEATFTIACADGGTMAVTSTTEIDFCVGGGVFGWVSSGDSCTVCTIIAEMAPSPIVSDNRGDDLPLGRVVRLRVVELARAGRRVVLLAENDAGGEAEYEWRVSGGTLERVADDVVIWTLPDERASTSGQVAVWNDEGAAVENFLWGAA